jgi:ATP-binding cassette subfamily F protein uup
VLTSTAAEGAKPTAVGSKLSYKEKHELEALPERIESLETQLGELQKKTADPTFYEQPGEEIACGLQQLAELETELGAAYERWEILEARATG